MRENKIQISALEYLVVWLTATAGTEVEFSYNKELSKYEYQKASEKLKFSASKQRRVQIRRNEASKRRYVITEVKFSDLLQRNLDDHQRTSTLNQSRRNTETNLCRRSSLKLL